MSAGPCATHTSPAEAGPALRLPKGKAGREGDGKATKAYGKSFCEATMSGAPASHGSWRSNPGPLYPSSNHISSATPGISILLDHCLDVGTTSVVCQGLMPSFLCLLHLFLVMELRSIHGGPAREHTSRPFAASCRHVTTFSTTR